MDEIIALGGISQRSDFAVQVAADVLGMPIKVSATEEGPALGAAMCAATAAGHYATVQEAQAAMAPGFKTTYEPHPGRAAQYTEGYQRYRALAEIGGIRPLALRLTVGRMARYSSASPLTQTRLKWPL